MPKRQMPADKFKPTARKPRIRKTTEEFTFAIAKSSLGLILVVLSEFGIVSILAGANRQQLVTRLQTRFRTIRLRENEPAAKAALKNVIHFIERPISNFDLPLNMRGTPFQQRVWHAVCAIPAGKTSTYTEIAQQIGAPRAVRAVGSTCTRNPFFMAVPCHRVLRKAESLAASLAKCSKRQRELLTREAPTSRKKRRVKKPAL